MSNLDILKLSKFIIYYCNNAELEITLFKLQKLLYYIQAWHLVYFNRDPLFNELAEAWANGPVYRSVYNQYKSKGLENEKDPSAGIQNTLKELKLSKNQKELVYTVLQKYGTKSAGQLVFLTADMIRFLEKQKT